MEMSLAAFVLFSFEPSLCLTPWTIGEKEKMTAMRLGHQHFTLKRNTATRALSPSLGWTCQLAGKNICKLRSLICREVVQSPFSLKNSSRKTFFLNKVRILHLSSKSMNSFCSFRSHLNWMFPPSQTMKFVELSVDHWSEMNETSINSNFVSPDEPNGDFMHPLRELICFRISSIEIHSKLLRRISKLNVFLPISMDKSSLFLPKEFSIQLVNDQHWSNPWLSSVESSPNTWIRRWSLMDFTDSSNQRRI